LSFYFRRHYTHSKITTGMILGWTNMASILCSFAAFTKGEECKLAANATLQVTENDFWADKIFKNKIMIFCTLIYLQVQCMLWCCGYNFNWLHVFIAFFKEVSVIKIKWHFLYQNYYKIINIGFNVLEVNLKICTGLIFEP